MRVCSSTGRDKDILESRLEGQASESEERKPGKGKSRKRKGEAHNFLSQAEIILTGIDLIPLYTSPYTLSFI